MRFVEFNLSPTNTWVALKINPLIIFKAFTEANLHRKLGPDQSFWWNQIIYFDDWKIFAHPPLVFKLMKGILEWKTQDLIENSFGGLMLLGSGYILYCYLQIEKKIFVSVSEKSYNKYW